MQTTMLEAPTTMTTLATATTTQHTDKNNDGNADNDVRSTTNDDNTGYCDILSTLTAMQRTMLEAKTMMATLTTATTSAR